MIRTPVECSGACSLCTRTLKADPRSARVSAFCLFALSSFSGVLQQPQRLQPVAQRIRSSEVDAPKAQCPGRLHVAQ